jgi:general secretion pathway protein I
MSFRVSRCDNQPTRTFGPRSRPAANAAFTLIEVLVAIAVLAIALAAIGAVVGSTVRGIRSIERRLPLLETARNVLASLPDRNALQLGSQFGSSGDLRWRIDVVPLAAPALSVAPPSMASANPPTSSPLAAASEALNWMPVTITVRVQGTEGPPLRLDTVRLIPRSAR